MIINSETKIAAILKKNPAALEAIVSITPKFEKLRNPLFTLITQFCAMCKSITEAVKTALQNAFPMMEITLELTFEPTWNQEMISEAGIHFLNH